MASGTIAVRRPARTRTRCTGRPAARSRAASTMLCVIDSSCTGTPLDGRARRGHAQRVVAGRTQDVDIGARVGTRLLPASHKRAEASTHVPRKAVYMPTDEAVRAEDTLIHVLW